MTLTELRVQRTNPPPCPASGAAGWYAAATITAACPRLCAEQGAAEPEAGCTRPTAERRRGRDLGAGLGERPGARGRGGRTMLAFLTQLLITLVLVGFFLVSCQNVLHIVRGSVRFLLKHVHQELDKELGESEGLTDDEESISTRVVRRRVIVKVTRAGRGSPEAALPVGLSLAPGEPCRASLDWRPLFQLRARSLACSCTHGVSR
ncbi:uncharacterized protein RBU57_011413 [Macrochelys suwanniensis]